MAQASAWEGLDDGRFWGSMILVKSVGVGLFAVLVAIPIGFLALSVFLKIRTGQNIGIDVVALSRDVVVRLLILLVFALGFFWEYRRLTGK